MKYLYVVCRYYPDFYKEKEFYDHAVILANENEMTLVGIDLAALGIKEKKHPTFQLIIDYTFTVMIRRIEVAIDTFDKIESFLNVLDRIIEGNQTNIQYRGYYNIEKESKSIPEVAHSIFLAECGAKLEPSVCISSKTWHKDEVHKSKES